MSTFFHDLNLDLTISVSIKSREFKGRGTRPLYSL